MRYIRTFDPSLNRSPWTSDEDARMNKLVSVLGTTDWPDVARHMPGRTNEMCRERYTEGRKGKGKGKAKAKGEDEERDSEGETAEKTEKAGTSRKTDWTEAQDTELIRLVGEIGNKWQKISEAMGGVYNNNQVYSRFSTSNFLWDVLTFFSVVEDSLGSSTKTRFRITRWLKLLLNQVNGQRSKTQS